MKNLFEERRFLNRNGFHSTASICVTINEDDEREYSRNFSPIEVDFSMSDCSRTINLAIDTYTIKELENSLFKLQQIEEVCRKAREALEKTRPIIKEFEDNKKIEKTKNDGK